MDKDLFLKCNCSTHAIQLQDLDWNIGKDDNAPHDFAIAFWKMGRDGEVPMSFKERLRWCWNILKTGNPWADEVLLRVDDVKKLRQFADDYIAAYDKKESVLKGS